MTTSLRTGLGARIGVAALGVGILTAVGSGAALAATEDTIDVQVEIAPVDGPGDLALSVAGDAVSLAEGPAVGTDRLFTGTLPTVTVTDTREAADVPVGEAWYVLGTITDFAGDAEQPDITSAEAFGWYPKLLSGDGTNTVVAQGDEVPPGTEDGFLTEEILVTAADSAAAAGGTYTANAELALRTPNTVAPGNYSATMTLSLIKG